MAEQPEIAIEIETVKNPKKMDFYYTIDGFLQLLTQVKQYQLQEETKEAINKSREVVERLINSNTPVYGINTGFGEMINRIIPLNHAKKLQANLLRSHATGVGKIVHPLLVKSMMLARLITLKRGFSGIKLDTLNRVLLYLNNEIYPLVHEQGSLGASGDLSPLSEIAISLIGEGEATKFPNKKIMQNHFIRSEIGKVVPSLNYKESSEICQNVGIPANYELLAKEGLSLINGTSGMVAYAIFACALSEAVVNLSLLTTCFSLAALKASTMPFDSFGVKLKGHPAMGQIAEIITNQLQGCTLIRDQKNIVDKLKLDVLSSQATDDVIRVSEYLQNAYSLRCIPQVIGAVQETLHFAKVTVELELNGVNDNPLIISDEIIGNHYVYHGAHFHGQYIAFVMDYLKIAMTQLAQLSDRRIARLIDSKYSEGLPDLLAVKKEGLQCGLEGLQYAATSVVAEMKSLANSASVQSIPSNLNNQDLVSMGMVAARHSWEITKMAMNVQVIELRTAIQALEIRLRQELKLPLETPELDETDIIKILGHNLGQQFIIIRKNCNLRYIMDDEFLLSKEINTLKEWLFTSIFDGTYKDISTLFKK